jgi:hypothetical protein
VGRRFGVSGEDEAHQIRVLHGGRIRPVGNGADGMDRWSSAMSDGSGSLTAL